MFNFSEFYNEYFPKIRDYAQTFGLQRTDSEDVSQGVLINIWQKIQDGRANPLDEGINGYLYKLARWRITDKSRTKAIYSRDHMAIGKENDLDELPYEEKPYDARLEILDKATRHVKTLVSRNEFEYFRAQTFDGKDADEMFRTYGIKKSHAYLVKCRIGQKVVAVAKNLLQNL